MAKRMGLPKKYIKLGGGFTKKAWRLFREAKAGAKKKIKATFKKDKRKKTTTVRALATSNKKRSSTMAKKKSKSRKRRRTITFFNSEAGKAIVNIGGGTTIGLLSVVGSETIPKIKDLPTVGKASALGVLGLITFMVPAKAKAKRAKAVVATGLLMGSFLTALVPQIRKTKWGADLFKADTKEISGYQKKRLGKYNGGKSLRSSMYGPVDEMGGPVDEMAGPVDTMGTGMHGADVVNTGFASVQ